MEKPYIIVYKYSFDYNGKKFAFRHKHLFDITGTCPKYIPISFRDDGSKGIKVGKKWLSWSMMQELTKFEKPHKIDLSNCEWYSQLELDYCFNLHNHQL